MIGIYKVVNPKGKVYIGQSIDIEKRLYDYKKMVNCTNQTKLVNSFKKYGTSAHKFKIVEECSEDLLNLRERYWQDYYNVLNEGLNCRLTTTHSKSGRNSIESNIKRKKSMIGKNKGPRPDVSERNKIVHKGKTISAEQRKAISKKLKGVQRSYTGERGETLRKPVIQYSKDGKTLIKEHISLTEAAKAVNRDSSDIHRVVSGRGKTCAGYRWKYKH